MHTKPTAAERGKFGRALYSLRLRMPTFIGILLAFLTGDAIRPLVVLLVVISLGYIVSGLIKNELTSAGHKAAYGVIVAIFIVLAAVTLSVPQPWSYYILAIAWLLHASWDVYHYKINRIVPRWMSEFCVVYDVLVAITLIALANQ